jgi:hypothetical protein
MHRAATWTITLATSLVVALAAFACGDEDDDGDIGLPSFPTAHDGDPTPQAGGSENVVDVMLVDGSVVADPASVDAGPVTFRIRNDGPKREHEFMIVRTELAENELPTNDDGSVNEDEVDVVEEVEEFPVGETEQITVDLDAGAYVLLCNVVEDEDGEATAHYGLGMHRAFTVE